jgi:hypothetical protein
LIFEFVEMILPMILGDGEGTGNTVPPILKRKKFQVYRTNPVLNILYRQKVQFRRVKFSF